MSIQTPEQSYSPNPANIEALQAGRMEAADAKSKQELRRAFLPDRIGSPNTVFSKVPDTAGAYDHGVLQPEDLVAIEALGGSAEEAVKQTGPGSGPEFEEVGKLQVEDETITLKRYGEGYTLNFSLDGNEPDFGKPKKPQKITEQIQQGFTKSPAHQELNRINEELLSGPETPELVTTKPFDPKEYPLGTASFLQDIGLVNFSYSLARQMRRGESVERIIESSLSNVPDYVAASTETESSRVFMWGRDAVKTLTIDKTDGSYTYSVRANKLGAYHEEANQAPTVTEIPFVETECAKELCNLLDEAGLMFSPEFQMEMMEAKEANRYGSVYTHITREIAKWVNSPNRTKLSNLVVPFDPEYQGKSLLEKGKEAGAWEYRRKVEGAEEGDLETQTREAWKSASREVNGEAAGVVASMINQSLDRQSADELETELPVTNNRIEIRDGSCFDVATYYISAAGETVFGRKLDEIDEHGVPLLEMSLGVQTHMLVRPTNFNGVTLPKGSLMLRQDDGWAFMRLTPFSFESPEDQLAFGSELPKALKEQVDNLKLIGSVSVEALVERVKETKR